MVANCLGTSKLRFVDFVYNLINDSWALCNVTFHISINSFLCYSEAKTLSIVLSVFTLQHVAQIMWWCCHLLATTSEYNSSQIQIHTGKLFLHFFAMLLTCCVTHWHFSLQVLRSTKRCSKLCHLVIWAKRTHYARTRKMEGLFFRKCSILSFWYSVYHC